MEHNWKTYLLKCADASLYCGVTNDLEKRLASHNQGTASKYTRSRIPVTLAAVRHQLSKSEAYKLEYIIKKTRADKKIKTLLDWNFSNEGGSNTL
jgi:putative endonuclease